MDPGCAMMRVQDKNPRGIRSTFGRQFSTCGSGWPHGCRQPAATIFEGGSMLRSKVWILAGALTLALGCAHGGIGSSEGWSVMQSQHFNVYVGAPRHATTALAGLEYSYASLSSSFFRGVELPKVDVLFLEEDEFNDLLGFRRSH